MFESCYPLECLVELESQFSKINLSESDYTLHAFAVFDALIVRLCCGGRGPSVLQLETQIFHEEKHSPGCNTVLAIHQQ